MKRGFFLPLIGIVAILALLSACSLIVPEKNENGGGDADADSDSDSDSDGTSSTLIGFPSASGLVTSTSYQCKLTVGGVSPVGDAVGGSYRVRLGSAVEENSR